MSLVINKKVASILPSASSGGVHDACAVFGKEEKCKIGMSKIESGCNYNSHHLGIDKMTVLLPVESEEARDFIENVLISCGKGMGFKRIFGKQPKTWSKKPKLIYRKKWKSTIASHFFLEIMPIFPGVPYVRVTLNPSKMGAQGIAVAKSQLNVLLSPSGYKSLVLDGRIAYMEVCFDVPAEKSALSLYCNRVHSSPDYSPNKQDGTHYFGKKSSSLSFKVYNRKKKMQRVEQEAVPEEHMTRLEAMVKHVAFNELTDMATPFTRLHVFETAKLDIDNAVKDPASFKEIMHAENFFSAMKSLPHYRRQKAMLHFASAIPAWWSPTDTWKKQWSGLIAQYGLLSSSCNPLLKVA